MTWLAKYVRKTFFGKKIASFEDAEGYVVVTARHDVRGEVSIKTLAIGSNAKMQAKADEALATLHDEAEDEVEAARQVVVLAPVEYVLSSNFEQRLKDAKNILETMWRDAYDDAIVVNGKRGVDCLQIGKTIRDNPHMSPNEWWGPIVGDGDRAYTLDNIKNIATKSSQPSGRARTKSRCASTLRTWEASIPWRRRASRSRCTRSSMISRWFVCSG
jgi:hypothetical protein